MSDFPSRNELELRFCLAFILGMAKKAAEHPELNTGEIFRLIAKNAREALESTREKKAA